MDEEYWNLDQVLSWVAWRDPQIVKTLQTVSDYSSGNYFSDFITPYDKGERKTYAEIEHLLTLLRSGCITAYGYYGDNTKNYSAIPASSWVALEFKTIMRHPAFATPIRKRGLRWNEISLKRTDIESFYLASGKNKPFKGDIFQQDGASPTKENLYGKIGDKAREWLEVNCPKFNTVGKMQPHGSNAAMCRWIINELGLRENQFQTVRDYSRESVSAYKEQTM